MNQTIIIPDTWQSEPFEFWIYTIEQKLKKSRLSNEAN